MNSIAKNIINKWKKYEKNQYNTLATFPDTLMIEVTNACNLSCTMCMNPKMKRKKGFISLVLVKKILDDAKKSGIKNIALYTTGESFLHSDIFEIISISKSYGFYTYITTNLLVLDIEKINKLLSTNIDSIKYSLDGLNKTEYESIRKKGNYEKLLKNMKLIKQKRDKNKSKTKLSIGVILTKQNISQKQRYIDTYGKYVDEIVFSLISNQSGHISSDEYKNLKPSEVDFPAEWKPCRQLWDRIIVTHDGKLVACCIDFESQLTYGDINNSYFLSEWNNQTMQTFREEHIEHKFNKMKLCQKCDSPYIQQSSVWEQING